VRRSWWPRAACCETSYDHFIGSDEAVARKFSQTDLPRQKQMLRESFKQMCDFFGTRRSNP
jgi:hypothetical protein